MAVVSDATIENSSSKREGSNIKSLFSTPVIILASIALFFMLVSIVFIVLFASSSQSSINLEEELRSLKNNFPSMSCEWMRQCSRKRSGPAPLLVISMDGMANRYINGRSTPTIKKMGECGNRAEHLIPSFPSKTFPNHFSIATGLYPGSHGIVDNAFYTPDGTKYDTQNGSFYGGEPIWNTVVKNGKVSKTVMWLGSYDKIKGIEATYEMPYDSKVSFITRIDNVTSWLSSSSPPALTMLYLEQPDQMGHAFGPDSDEVRQATITMDGLLNYILRKLGEAGILGCTNVVLVSDHGMRNIKKQVSLQSIDASYAEARINEPSKAANNVIFYQNVSTSALQCRSGVDYRVYRSSEDLPLRFHYSHPNIGFPFLLGNPGVMFSRTDAIRAAAVAYDQRGNHGWDNMDEQMRAIFYAMGPSIRVNYTAAPFQNTQLYNFFADLMGIPGAPNNGTSGLLDDLFIDPPVRAKKMARARVQPCRDVVLESCADPKQEIPLSEVSAFLHSSDASVCSISTGRLVLLYSTSSNKTIGMEITPDISREPNGDIRARMGNTVIGPDCGQGGRSVIDGLGHESDLKLTWIDFKSLSLIDQALSRLPRNKHVRIQIGLNYREDGSMSSVFVAGVWCEGEGWRGEMDYCQRESDTRTEAYLIPQRAHDNFNCLDKEALLFDHRASIDDLEKSSSLSLLPESMPLPMRNRVALRLPAQKF